MKNVNKSDFPKIFTLHDIWTLVDNYCDSCVLIKPPWYIKIKPNQNINVQKQQKCKLCTKSIKSNNNVTKPTCPIKIGKISDGENSTFVAANLSATGKGKYVCAESTILLECYGITGRKNGRP